MGVFNHLGKLGAIGGLFGSRPDHPLADPKALRDILAAVPGDPFKAIDEITGWFDALLAAENFPIDHLFHAIRQLDEAAQPAVRKLSREYLSTPRLSRTEERRHWAAIQSHWRGLAASLEHCLAQVEGNDKAAQQFKSFAPLFYCRLLAAQAQLVKWGLFRYGPSTGEIWQRMGRAYALAEKSGLAQKSTALYPGSSHPTSPRQEYLKALMLQVSSTDALQALEIELVERLIIHFMPDFVFGPQDTSESVYWVDLDLAQAPLRLAQVPSQMTASLRYFQPGPAHDKMVALAATLASGEAIPADVHLGGQFHPRTVLPVCRHLAAYWAPVPPQRRHERHRVQHRVQVIGGMPDVLDRFHGRPRREGAPAPTHWLVGNVSRGGFGAVVDDLSPDWLRIGTVLALQPEGGDNWLLGVIRRFRRVTEIQARIGIQSLSRDVVAVELRPQRVSTYAAAAGISALWLRDMGQHGEWWMAMPPASFDLRDTMDLDLEGQRLVLTPIALVEQNGVFELARYRQAT